MQVRLIIPHKGLTVRLRTTYLSAIADIAGGFTAYHGTGGWKDDKGFLVVEPVTVFDFSLADDTSYSSDHGVGAIRQLASRIACELKQKCVYLSIDGKAEYIKP